MSNLRVKCHPTLGILVGTDGHVLIPATKRHPARWTFGYKRSDGYRKVRIAGKLYFVHRLVAETFIGPIPKDMEVDHISRDRSSNMLSNLRIVSRSGNRRNCADHDRVTERGGTHYYEDERQYKREYQALYRESKCKTHRQVRFSDNSLCWIPLTEALELQKIPLKQRIFNK